MSKLLILRDAEVETLCKFVCRTRELITNLQAADVGQPPMINTPGHNISMQAVKNLKLACCFIYHHARTSRVYTAATVVLADVWKLRALRELEK